MMNGNEMIRLAEAEAELSRLRFAHNELNAKFALVYMFLVRQFPQYFAGEQDIRGVDPTLNPIALPITQAESDAYNAALQEMHVEHQPDLPPEARQELNTARQLYEEAHGGS